MIKSFFATPFLQPIYFIAMIVVLAVACTSGLSVAAGVGMGIYTLSLIDKRNYGRAICAALLMMAVSLTAWGALIVACLLTGALLAESWLADSRSARIARLLAATLVLKFILFVILPDVALHLRGINGSVIVVVALSAVAIFCELLARPTKRTAIDPLLVVLFATILFSSTLAMALLSVSITYPKAMLLVTAGICFVLVATVILVAPLTRFRPSQQMMSYAFSLQVPLEEWIASISSYAASKTAVHDFIDSSLQEFITLPGVLGVSWQLNEGEMNHIGKPQKQTTDLNCPPLFVQLHTRRHTSPWEWFNYYLLLRIIAEYCIAKQREEHHRADNLNRAVHETGSRLTHDIKNILHALAALTQLKNTELVIQQLPVLRERLETTLHKLQVPAGMGDAPTPAAVWWEKAQQRHAHQPVLFSGTASGDLPTALFDLALDNFISNGLVKRQLCPPIVIRAVLSDDKEGAVLQVIDDGEVISPDKAAKLFVMPVSSNSGFGVALYQVGIEAAKQDYFACLECNEAGNVIFALRKRQQ